MPQIKFVETKDFMVEKRVSSTPMPFMHHHLSFEIFYIISGEREYFIEDDFFKLREGDMVIVPENLLHRTDGKSASRYLIYFSRPYLEKYLTSQMISSLAIHRPSVFRPDEEQREQLKVLFNKIFSEYEKAPEDDPRLFGYLLQILLMLTNSNSAYAPSEYTDNRIEEIIKYINESYASINNIDEIASRFYISKYYLCRLFNQNLGTSLITYLNTIKIRKACEMLCEEKYSITDTATKCGFNSPSYFCKVFKEERGISPSQYKKQHKCRVE